MIRLRDGTPTTHLTDEIQQRKPRNRVLHRSSHPLYLASHLGSGEGVDGVLMNFPWQGKAGPGAAGLGVAR